MFEAALASLRPRRKGSIAVSTGLHAALAGALLLPPMLRMPELGVEPPDRVPPFVELVDKTPKSVVVPDQPPPPPAAALAGAKSNVSVVTAPTEIPTDLPKPLRDGEKEAPEVIGTFNRKAEVVNDDPALIAPAENPGKGSVLPANAPGVTAPVALFTPGPEYPELMRRVGIEGVVILEAVIDRAGRVTDVRVLRPVNPVLDLAATDAVRKWRYEPARVDANPVAVYLTVTINFRINR